MSIEKKAGFMDTEQLECAADCLFDMLTHYFVVSRGAYDKTPKRIASVMCDEVACSAGFVVKLSEGGTPLPDIGDVTSVGMFCSGAGNMSAGISNLIS